MPRPSGKALNPEAFYEMLERLDPPMTQAAVADAAGISASTLSDLISGTTRAADGTATSLALVLRCKRGALFPEYVQFGARPRPGKTEPAVAS